MSNHERPLELDLPGDTLGNAKTDQELFRERTGEDRKDPRPGRNFGSQEKLDKVAAERYDKMPSLRSVCEGVISQVEKEDRQDTTVLSEELFINELGHLIKRPIYSAGGSYMVSAKAYEQLASKGPPSLKGLKNNINLWTGNNANRDKRMVLRHYGARMRIVYAVVSEKYAPFDANDCAAVMADVFPDLKGEAKYVAPGARYEIRAVLGKPFDVKGDLHRAMICLRSADNGTSAQRFYLRVWRLTCANGMYVAGKGLLGRVIHTQGREALAAGLERAFQDSYEAIEAFSQQWGKAMTSPFTSREHEDVFLTPEEAIKRIIQNRVVHVPYMKRDTLQEKVMQAWRKEQDESVAGVINAITRTAHENSWKSPWYQDDLEEQAGQLLYNTVNWSLPAVEESNEA